MFDEVNNSKHSGAGLTWMQICLSKFTSSNMKYKFGYHLTERN